MNTKFPTLALSLGFLMSAAGGALGDGTYVYGDGSTKDYMAGVAVPAPMPVPMQEAEWYLRLDIGGSFVGGLSTETDSPGVVLRSAGDIPTSIFGEAGFGYRFNQNFRVDFTTNFHDSVDLSDASPQTFQAALVAADPANAGETLTNRYDVVRTDEIQLKQQSTNLVNFYYDIANKSRFTPYVGAGVGVTYVNIERQTSETANCYEGEDSLTGTVTPGACYAEAGANVVTSSSAEEKAEWLFSGALMAGFSYDINEYIALDAGYRVVYSPGAISRSAPTVTGEAKAEWDDLLQHQFRTGMRLKIF